MKRCEPPANQVLENADAHYVYASAQCAMLSFAPAVNPTRLTIHAVDFRQVEEMREHEGMTAMSTIFDNAISVHTSWVARFGDALRGISREAFDPKQLRDDTICEFGRWLHASSALFPDAERFEQVKKLHKSFHENAAEIALMLGQNARPQSLQARLVGLSGLSGQLVHAINDAKDYHAARK
jgi:hypothetical protein